MPKVTLNRVENNIRDFSGWVWTNMRAAGLRNTDVAEYLNISPQALNKKMNGKNGWNQRQMFQLYDLFGKQYEYK